MVSQFILVVSDESEAKHGEITMLDTPQEVERLVENLLEAGYGQERIRVFTGTQADVGIAYRPVVSLISGEADQAPQFEERPADDTEPEPVAVGAKTEHGMAGEHGGNGHIGAESQLSSAFPSGADEIQDEAGLGPVELYRTDGDSRKPGTFSAFFRSARDERIVISASQEVA